MFTNDMELLTITQTPKTTTVPRSVLKQQQQQQWHSTNYRSKSETSPTPNQQQQQQLKSNNSSNYKYLCSVNKYLCSVNKTLQHTQKYNNIDNSEINVNSGSNNNNKKHRRNQQNLNYNNSSSSSSRKKYINQQHQQLQQQNYHHALEIQQQQQQNIPKKLNNNNSLAKNQNIIQTDTTNQQMICKSQTEISCNKNNNFNNYYNERDSSSPTYSSASYSDTSKIDQEIVAPPLSTNSKSFTSATTAAHSAGWSFNFSVKQQKQKPKYHATPPTTFCFPAAEANDNISKTTVASDTFSKVKNTNSAQPKKKNYWRNGGATNQCPKQQNKHKSVPSSQKQSNDDNAKILNYDKSPIKHTEEQPQDLSKNVKTDTILLMTTKQSIDVNKIDNNTEDQKRIEKSNKCNIKTIGEYNTSISVSTNTEPSEAIAQTEFVKSESNSGTLSSKFNTKPSETPTTRPTVDFVLQYRSDMKAAKGSHVVYENENKSSEYIDQRHIAYNGYANERGRRWSVESNSDIRYQQHNQRNEQHYSNCHPQPQQLTIGSFLKKNLLLEINNNDGKQFTGNQHHRYQIFHQPLQQQQQQQLSCQTPQHYSSGDAQTRFSKNSHGFVFMPQQNQNAFQQPQQCTRRPQQLHHSSGKKSGYNCHYNNISSNSAASFIPNTHQRQSNQTQHLKPIETLKSTNNGPHHHRNTYRLGYNNSQNYYYQHHHYNQNQQHHPQHTGATTPTTPQHQNFYNLTYVSTDAMPSVLSADKTPNNCNQSASEATQAAQTTTNAVQNLNCIYQQQIHQPQQPHQNQIGRQTKINHRNKSSRLEIPPLQLNLPLTSVKQPALNLSHSSSENIIYCAQLDEAITTAAAAAGREVANSIAVLTNNNSTKSANETVNASSNVTATTLPKIVQTRTSSNTTLLPSPNVCNQSNVTFSSLMPSSRQLQQQDHLNPSHYLSSPQVTGDILDSDHTSNQQLFFSFGGDDCFSTQTYFYTPNCSTTPSLQSAALISSPCDYDHRRRSPRSRSTTSVSTCSSSSASDSIKMENLCRKTLHQEEIPTISPLSSLQLQSYQQLQHIPYGGSFARCCPNHLTINSVSCYEYFTPPDRFLSRARNIEMKEPPKSLLDNSKYDCLSQEIWHRFTNSQQTQETFRNKMRLWRYLYILVKQTYPRYGLYLVGSTMTGFGTNGSDVDLCLVTKYTNFNDQRIESLYTLNLLRECLSSTGEFYNFQLIEARVPILRFKDKVHHIEVDLNFNNSVGIRNTHLLHLYSQLDWRTRPLILIVKLWAQFHDINDAKSMTISSYSLALMVIHFLQSACYPPVLPCLHDMFPDKFPTMGTGYATQKLRTSDFGTLDLNEYIAPFESTNSQTIGELLVEFLRYYSCFDFQQFAISVRTGGLLPVAHCRNAKSTKNDIHQWKELSIEEPFDLSNTARSVYDYETFDNIKAVFFNSWHMLQETLDLKSIFKPIPQQMNLPQTHLRPQSILTCVDEFETAPVPHSPIIVGGSSAATIAKEVHTNSNCDLKSANN